MSLTTNFSLNKPVAGTLNWEIPNNSNFDIIDSILFNLRKSYASTIEPIEHSITGSLWFDSNVLQDVLKVKKIDGSYQTLLDQAFADTRYAKLTGSTLSGTFLLANSILHWNDEASTDFAKILFQTFNTHKNLVFEFGSSEGLDAIRFNWNGSGTPDDILHIFSNKVKSFKNIEIPDGTADDHAINKGQADATYSALNHNHDGAYALKAGSFSQAFNVKESQSATYNAIPRNQADALYSTISHNHNADYSNINHTHTKEHEPLSGSAMGNLTANQICKLYIATKSFEIPVNLSGSKAIALVPPSSITQTFNIQKSSDNGSSFSTIASFIFNTNNKVAVLNTNTLQTINIGDIIKIVAPSSIDLSIANIVFNIAIN